MRLLFVENHSTFARVVIVKVRGVIYLHLINAVRGGPEGRQYQIGNNRGGTNGWVSRKAIFGKAIAVDK